MRNKMLQYKDLSLITCILVIFFVFQTSNAQEMYRNDIKTGRWKGENIEYWEGQMLVKIKRGVSNKALINDLSKYEVELKKDFNKLRWGLLEVPSNVDIFQKIEQLKKHPLIESISPNAVYRAYAYPNDPEYGAGKQWSLYNYGQNPPSGIDDADVDMPEAWGVTKGSSQVIVAILDSGIPMQNESLSHPELNSPYKITIGPDYIYGRTPFGEDDQTVKDWYGHGTHVAGIIGAKSNNSEGIAGITWNCKLLIIQVFDQFGFGDPLAFQDGVVYAVDYSINNNKPVVINYSGGGPDHQAVEDAVAYAEAYCTIVAASGNSSIPQNNILYPAAHASNYYNVISVGATQYDDVRAHYSNYGPELLIVAPGGADDNHDYPTESGDIYSTMPDYEVYLNRSPHYISPDYGYMAGTSMATPHVSATAAMILSLNDDLYPDEVVNILMETAEQVPGMGGQYWTSEYGYGRLNCNRAVLYTKYDIENIEDDEISGIISENTLLHGEVSITNNLTVNAGINLVVEDEAVINVNTGKAITVHGSIIAKDVTFQGNGGADWYGIDVDGATYSYIKNSTIKDCDYGVIIGGSSTLSLYGNDIQADEVGVTVIEDANPNISNCYIRANGLADLLCSGSSDGLIASNSLCGISNSGHRNIGSASPLFNYYGQARNLIDGRDFAVSVYVLGGYPTYDNGKNLIENSYGGHFNNSSGHSLNARYNYWDGTTVRITGPVVWQPALSSPPNPVGPNWSLSKDYIDDLHLAWQTYYEGDYIKAKQMSEDVLSANMAMDCAGEALFLSMKCSYRLGQLGNEQNRLAGFNQDKRIHQTAKYEAIRWQMKHEIAGKRIQKARDFALSIPNTSFYGRELLLDLAIGLLDKWGELEEATKILDMMVTRYPDKETLQIRDDVLSFYKTYLSIRKETNPEGVSFEENLTNSLQGYPNPFNMNCAIVYQLEKTDWVRVSIYDILGREVKTLINNRKKKGIHQVTWNGTDKQGRTVSNGVYLCRLDAGGQQQTLKLLLVK